MRDHAIVSPHFWTGDTGRQLRKDPEAQRVAFYLMTCPGSNMIGLYYLPIPLICHEVGISEEGAYKALARLSEVGFAEYDAPSEVVFVKQMARYQIGDTISVKDNRHLGVQRQLAQMKSSRFYNEFVERYNESFHLNLEPLGSPLKPLPSKGKGKDKEKDKDKDVQPTAAKMSKQAVMVATENGAMDWASPEAFVALYNIMTPEDHPKVTLISEGRRKHITGYLQQFPDKAFWEQVYTEICRSAFLLGQKSSEGRRPIKRGLDWLLQKGEDGIENCVKTYEGKYRDTEEVHSRPGNGLVL